MSTAYLAKPLRRQLENTVKQAREVATAASEAAVFQLGIGDKTYPPYLSAAQQALRVRLRAHGRALGDVLHPNESQTTQHLVSEIAYEHWHRMLFARFLAENHLLLWEPGAPVTLEDCKDLVQDPTTSLGAKSGWELAGNLAARMLPRVFQANSPVFELTLAPEHQRELERLLEGLPTEVFQASDSLGWVYQFWQVKRKDEVNASEVKIGADELPAVTQLFTEPYMVQFLLHNSLGAWWVMRFPGKRCPVELTYLRRLEDGTPAAGKFEGWPDTLSEFKLLDPCSGSGHFLVAAFLMLVPMRMEAEGLSARAAVDAVLADNLYGLELDQRCVEIAVFALALTAWRYLDEAGQPLGVRADMPAPNVACCGLKVPARPQHWEALVPNSLPNASWMRQEMRLLHRGFSQAPLLGSLLDPADYLKKDLATPNFHTLSELLERGLTTEGGSSLGAGTEDTWDFALSAQGLFEAARILAGHYHLVITNVPYLTRGRQADELRDYCDRRYPEAKNELANVFLMRCLELTKAKGVVQVVMPQNWLFLPRFKRHRETLLKRVTWNLIARLGPGAFETITGEVVNVVLLTQTNAQAPADFLLRGIDATKVRPVQAKAELLRIDALLATSQRGQLDNAGLVVHLTPHRAEGLLGDVAETWQGLVTSDDNKFVFAFWEVPIRGDIWVWMQMPPQERATFTGRHAIVRWEGGSGDLHKGSRAHNFPTNRMLGRTGVAVQRMKNLNVTLFSGNVFGDHVAPLVPNNPEILPALWCFCNSDEFSNQLKKIDQTLKKAVGAFLKTEFDVEYWNAVAAESYPNGLPKPFSNDPTQWLFHGHPQPASAPLQVAVARLLGYTWPAESDDNMELSDEARSWIARGKALTVQADDDGIVCLNPVRGEKPAHERLLALLIDSWETVEPGSWKNTILDRLLAAADCAGKDLATWLRDKFFEQHARLFHHRPFIWHIWDGLKDGFGALVNYHKLDAKNLERLIHAYLGDWIRTQEAGVATGEDGAQQRLAAAIQLKTKLEQILDGEAPYDIFVRWKPLEAQPIGWNPDLNDGVRLNIRPFVQAQVLRHNNPSKLNVKWDKDRGKDVEAAPWFHLFQGDRINDHHLPLAEKQAAREKSECL